MAVVSFIVLLLPCLVKVRCQLIFPFVSFMGQPLANHSYVDISQVGTGSDSVQCHTDLSTCCSSAQGPHRGDWYFPNGTRLTFHSAGNALSQYREAQRVDLRRISGTGPTGIYHCDIETDDVHDYHVRETVYVGLYNSDEGKCCA